MLRSGSEIPAAHKMNDDALLDSKALSFVDSKCEPGNQWELIAGHTGSLLPIGHRQNWNPLWLMLIKGRTTVIFEMTDNRFWKGTDWLALRVNDTDQLAARAIGEPELIGDIPCENYFASSNKIYNRSQTTESRRR